jgi:diphthine-ammonia ligase
MTARPTAAISWSGGKDCCLALLREWDRVHFVAAITMFDDSGGRSRSHGLRPEVVAAQTARLGLDQYAGRCTWETYTDRYIATLAELKARGVSHIVFGDIMGDSHREWNLRVCAAHDLTAIMPLWGQATSTLVRDFLALGGEARLVTVRPPLLDEHWLGTTLTEAAVTRLEARGVDPCGEFGEYHTVVTNCPRFSAPLPIAMGEQVFRGGCWAIDYTIEASPDRDRVV